MFSGRDELVARAADLRRDEAHQLLQVLRTVDLAAFEAAGDDLQFGLNGHPQL